MAQVQAAHGGNRPGGLLDAEPEITGDSCSRARLVAR
jgi:hypothetical protein